MTGKTPFSVEKYVNAQVSNLRQRIVTGEPLFVEIGGFISHDRHASRVLPGYDPDTKLLVLGSLQDADFIYCVNSKDIEADRRRSKGRGELLSDFVVGDLERITALGLGKPQVALTMFEDEPKVARFQDRLHQLGYGSYTFGFLAAYPEDVNAVLSPEGFGRYHRIETESEIVVVVGAGGNSGKMALAISQIYLNKLRGRDSSFTKMETFPIWNLPFDHPVNVAYEFATANHGDDNALDILFKRKTGLDAVTYDRDIENFRVLSSLLREIFGREIFSSPTEMCVNMLRDGFEDEGTIRAAAEREIKRRYVFFRMNPAMNLRGITDFERCAQLIKKYDLDLGSE